VDIPQAFMDDETGYNAGTRRNSAAQRAKSGGGGRSWMVTFTILMIFVLVAGYSVVTYHERKMMKSQLLEQDATMRELEIDLSMKFDSQIRKLKDENGALQRKLTDQKSDKVTNQNLKIQTKHLEQTVKDQKEKVKKLNEEKGKVEKRKTKLQESIQQFSKMALLEKFGPGPHQLEIFLRFDSHLGRDDEGIITIEMAPVDEMPHAVYWFLEQVSRKLYDGFSFHRNAGHVIQGGAARNFLSDPDHPPSEQPFKDAGFHSVLFQEYSDKFPHNKYTLGFAGRPGGPEFYISKKDNSKIHGPGGQKSYEDSSEADPCFAKVIDGFDLVDRMMGLPVKDGKYKALKDNVAIVSIRRK
jgi:cyclophilin family peptidyl-prolyl cis-trans isomerase